MKLAILGNYPPKACGIGTFTNSLARAILSNLRVEDIAEYAEIIAMEDPVEAHRYPEEVTRTINPAVPEDYRTTADYLNDNNFDLLVVQHEYGIFGGDDGVHLLHLLDRLKIPLVVTLHTVLKEPTFGQLTVLKRIGERAQALVVMSSLAKEFLIDVFQQEPAKIRVIEHGVPVIKTASRNELRENRGWADRKVLFTFGLLGRGKGIETAVRALPAIVAAYPETLYVVLGKTHPHVVRQNGEEYREYLQALAAELGVGENLRMIGKFASEQELFECLEAADVYVVPYPNEAQITSGTLAYAVGAGAGIVSTPFWHATELLSEGRGELFPFHDHDALATTVLRLFAEPETLAAMRERARAYGRNLSWPKIGKEYLEVFASAGAAYARESDRPGKLNKLPGLNLEHLLRMTDEVGIIQHAKYAIPNRHEGYCLDDNGRALLLVAMLLKRNTADRVTLERLSDTYLSYLYHAQNTDGTFRNFMTYDRRFLERRGSEDSYGRAIWSVGYCLAHPPRPDQRPLLEEIFIRAVGHLDEVRSPRTVAYGVIALSYYLEFKPGNEEMLNLLDRLCNRLTDHYSDTKCEGWNWFERYLTYSNGILPYAMFRALHHLPKEAIRQIANETTHFLAEQTIIEGVMSPIGCDRPFKHREERCQFDQQPVDVMNKVLLFSEACRHQKMQLHCRNIGIAFFWFLGENDLKTPVYEPRTGGCYDGLTKSGVNQNQGAESLLAYLISRVEIEDYLEERRSPKSALKKILNGFALPEPVPA